GRPVEGPGRLGGRPRPPRRRPDRPARRRGAGARRAGGRPQGFDRGDAVPSPLSHRTTHRGPRLMASIPATPADLPAPVGRHAPLIELLRGALGRADRRATLAGMAACAGLLGAGFWPNLRHFAYTWATDENYSHGFLVPLIALYFANEAAR